MDFDDLDKPTAPVRQSRFAPRGAKKPPAKPKTEPKPDDVAVVKTEPQPDDRMDIDVNSAAAVAKNGRDGGAGEKNASAFETVRRVGMEVEMETVTETEEKEEDYVVAEYDVYFTPPSSDSKLYVTQYPLRPSWRPYELDQRCKGVRVKPTSMEVEVDLEIDTESDYYDLDAPTAGRTNVQTLSSSGGPPSVASYAVGLLKGNKLYLNPIHSVVQLRPSMEYLDDVKKKNVKTAVKEEGSANAGPSKKQNTEKEPEVVESWVPVNYVSSTSDLAQTCMKKMVTEATNPLQFSMNPSDYLNYLCPGAMVNKMVSSGLSRRFLLSLPLEERLKKLFTEGPHIQRFNAIKHLTPDHPVEDVLKVVQQYANMVQGVWVVSSRVRYSAGNDKMNRDYALFLFSQNPVMKDSELTILGSRKSAARNLIREVAVERLLCKDWKFKESPDVAFMKLYPDIVEHQRNLWQDIGKRILDEMRSNANKLAKRRPAVPARSDEGLGKATDEPRSVNKSISKEAREVLTKILEKLFLTHKVCSFQTIRQGLRDTAVFMSQSAKAGARSNAVVEAIKNIVDAPSDEIQAIIGEYAVNVHGLYLLKSSTELPDLNPLRNDVIDLFRGREPSAKLKKGEIMDAAKTKPATSEFQKVINEYCVSKGGAWVLKSGDGVSSSDWQNIFKAAKLL